MIQGTRLKILLGLGTMAAVTVVVVLLATRSGEHVLQDIEGVAYGSLEHPAQGRWSVLFFLTSDCPIANQYAPEIRRICDKYEPEGARCYLVYADPSLTVEAVRKHAHDYHAARFPAVLDSGYRMVDAAGATVSSEVAVFSNEGKLAYRGRIDDFNADLGVPRQRATSHDLRDTLDALIAGRNVPNPRTETVGCFLPPRNPGAPS
jgi:hypothetical protein